MQGRILSKVFSPMPFMSVSWYMRVKAVMVARWSRMRWARVSPMPGRVSSAWASAVLMLIGLAQDADEGVARVALGGRQPAACASCSEQNQRSPCAGSIWVRA